MPQIINTNIASINAQRNLNKSQSANQSALQRLSSGLRINSAKDDAAGLAISTRFTSQIKGLNVAVRNAGDGIALAQTAEGALGTMNDNLQRIRELAVQSANATNSDVDRDALQAEVKQLVAEITRTAEETDFNGRKLLNGDFNAVFQVGANAGQTIDVSIAELTADKLGASKASGLSAVGNENALQNGDLQINNIEISPSKAEDDTASVEKQDASAIAKAEAINREYSKTGVKAYVNENVASGSEMTGKALSGTLVLNNVEINVQTTDDTASSRAAVVQAINAVSDQTGVVAKDLESDTLGVSLTAKDGRNISLGVNTTSTLDDFAAATGLAKAASYNNATGTGDFETYMGGFTLVADGDVSEIVVSGGNGTGNGDLKNSGLREGTYEKGAAQLTSVAQVDAKGGDTINGTQTFFALEGGAKTISNGSSIHHDLFSSAGNETLTLTNGLGQSVTLAATGGDVATDIASGGFGADKIKEALERFDGVKAIAETKVVLTGATLTNNAGGTKMTIRDTGSAGATLAQISFAGNTTSDTAQNIAATINALTTGSLVATVLGTSANSDVQIVDTKGNTLSFAMLRTTSLAQTVEVKSVDRAGNLSAVQTVKAGTTAVLNSTGNNVVAVGYIKDIEADNEKVKEFNLTTNLLMKKANAGTASSLGVVTGYLATSGSIGASSTQMGSSTVDVSAKSVAITQPLVGLGDGELVINSVNIGAADPLTDRASADKDTLGNDIQSSRKDASGIAIAAAINEVSDKTGVSAQVNETVLVGGDGSNFNNGSTGGSNYVVGDTGKIYINGVDVGSVSLLADASGDSIDEGRTRQSAIELINAKSDQTGVTAEDNGKSITLRAADGRNISVAIDNDAANNTGRGNTFGAQIGLDSAIDGVGEADIGESTSSNIAGKRGTEKEGDVYETTYSTVTLKSAKAINIGGGTKGTKELEALGLFAGEYGGGQSGQFLKDIDISTFEGAQEALTAIDNAIGAVASQRADLGAIQNRMQSTVNNLQVTSENLSAANSRIQDADFAAETAELSRTQVLQQAGISILAQANASGQQVLSLLG